MNRFARLATAAALVVGVLLVALYARQSGSARKPLHLESTKLPAGLFMTSNGGDMLGDDVPTDTLNYAPQPVWTSGFRTVTAGKWPTRSSARSDPAASSPGRRRSSARTWPPSARASTRAPPADVQASARA